MCYTVYKHGTRYVLMILKCEKNIYSIITTCNVRFLLMCDLSFLSVFGQHNGKSRLRELKNKRSSQNKNRNV